MGMVRKQVYLRADQDRRLKKESSERGVTEAEVLRDFIDRAPPARERTIGRDNDGLLSALQKIIDSVESGSPERPIRFRREEIYEERIQRQLPRRYKSPRVQR